MSALVIDGHPNPDSLTAALARRYTDAHGDARLLALRELDFDPISHFGYRGDQPLEPDLADALDAVFAADRIVVATPTWWASTPALLKGFFDRILLPKVTYRYRSNGLPEGLLTGRTGRVIITSDTPRWILPLTGDTAAKQISANTLSFCGIRPVRTMRFTNVRHASEATRTGWLERVAKAAGRDRASGGAVAGTQDAALLNQEHRRV
ncbi:NAD(P)H-dependent oxidoreductase [Microbacterium halotolerans]|uniref:NAD(P)H-dependent oxidoreductase n=1 Tax=Microbacterium halotolerans TaxID=246613 RepID=UPI000E6AA273|nr:NAD(P)H-dependent oxidoreductase [Microbacterium halotolerans]